MVGEAGQQRGPEIGVRLRFQPELGSLGPAPFVELEREREGLGCWLEPGDRPLEEELVADGVFDAEFDEAVSQVVERGRLSAFDLGE